MPREEAYSRYLDERNFRIFRKFLPILALVFLTVIIVNLADTESFNFSLILSAVNMAAILFLRIFFNRLFNVSNIRRHIFIFLISQLLILIAIKATYPDDEPEKVSAKGKTEQSVKKDTLAKGNDFNVTVSGKDDDYLSFVIFFGVMIMIFRFSRPEIVQLFAIGFSVPIAATLVFGSQLSPGNVIPSILLGVLFFVVAFSREKSRQRKFFDQYDFNYRKNYESMRMKKELDYAREIQLSMLPESDAKIGDLEISGVSIPASEVGGDYFDYFKISESETGFFICDVSGHGVASGLMLSGIRSCMHLILENESHPKEIMEKLNRMIRKTQSRRMFVTAILAIIDSGKNKCILFNAGHLPPYRISAVSKEIFRIKKHGIALGAMRNVEESTGENEMMFEFNKGDKLILYTDGVNEAMNASRHEYGLDNLELYLNGNSDKNANELLRGLIEDIKKFTSGSAQRDDLTILVIQRN